MKIITAYLTVFSALLTGMNLTGTSVGIGSVMASCFGACVAALAVADYTRKQSRLEPKAAHRAYVSHVTQRSNSLRSPVATLVSVN